MHTLRSPALCLLLVLCSCRHPAVPTEPAQPAPSSERHVTTLDYRPDLGPQLERLPAPELENLVELLALLETWTEQARNEPGHWQEEHGPKEYVPSDAELLLAEIGRAVKTIIQTHSTRSIRRELNRAGIRRDSVRYREVPLHPVGSEGTTPSCRADRPVPVTIELPK